MEYIAKSEIMDYISGKEKELVLHGKDSSAITEIRLYINRMYTYRPTMQAQWVRKRDSIVCSRCGFCTLIYKNTKYCPECGKMMLNGKAYDKR